MHPRAFRVSVGDGAVSASFDPAGDRSRAGARPDDRAPLFLAAHGAGGHMDDRGMQALTKELCARGLDVVRFNFPYRERRQARPDAMPVLMQTIAAVAKRAREESDARCLLLGGRSMGGRAASMLAADGFASDGLLLFAYPLHPAGRHDKLRDAHLPRITVPVLCVNGTRDPLCRRDLMESVVERLSAAWRMHWLEGADHSFHVLKSSGRTDADVLHELGAATAHWATALPCARRGGCY